MKNLHLKLSVLWLSTSVCLPLWAQEQALTKGLTPLQAYTLAFENNATLAAASADNAAIQERIPQARAALLPRAEARADISYNKKTTEYDGPTPFRSGDFDATSRNWIVELRQVIFNKASREALGQATVVVAQGDTALALAKQQLTLEVIQRYFALLLAQEAVDLSVIEQESAAEQFSRAKRGFDLGAATITDVHETQAGFDISRSREIVARNELAIARQTLGRVIGKEPVDIASLSKAVTLTPPQPQVMEHWVDKARKQNLQVILAEKTVEIAAREIGRQRGFAYPSVEAVARYGDHSDSSSNLGTGIDSIEASIGLEAKIPLYAGGIVGTQVRQVTALRQRAWHQLDDARQQATLQAQTAYLSLNSDILRVQALQQSQISSENSLKSTQRGFELGLRTGIDVLNARQQLFAARRDLASARYSYLLNNLKLQAAIGDLNEQDLSDLESLFHKG